MTGSGASGMSSRDYMPIDVGIKRGEIGLGFRVQSFRFGAAICHWTSCLIFDICSLRFAIFDLIFGIRTVPYHRMARYAAIIKMTNDK